ncbi:MAG: hypothetical protein HY260_02425 [Chloroflexi bacterium]|nr:hypothetical protein [Chloroflexota bacterium]
MPKTFYTERDIKDLADRGVTTLTVNDDVVLTDNARDLALKLGIRLVHEDNPHPEDGANAELAHRVKAAVIARLGDQVDAIVLDAVVTKVVNGLK